MAKDLPKHRYQRDPQPNAFTTEEAERVWQAFQAEQRQGKSYGHYAPLVEFLLYTGCRPSEAVGLQWQLYSV